MRRGGTDAMETISAAATAIASVENRVPQASLQKRKWGSCWSFYWCFGSQKNHHHRIGHSALVPEPTTISGVPAPGAGHPSHPPPPISLPFTAPPSSPASFLPSEPPSSTQSPTGLLSLTSASANMYSPGGPHSIFAIGPYAHETQLVSPPVFSTFSTEPSTAPYTPPPESVQLTTPSSPEVPFARLLEPNLRTGESTRDYHPLTQYEFNSYQLQPGSPVSHLISPCSGISGSGTSSPFRDPFFRPGNPPNLLDLENIVLREWESRQESGAVTPPDTLNRQDSGISPLPDHTCKNDENVVDDRRVSFEITAEEVVRCMEKPLGLPKAEQHKEEDKFLSGETSDEKVHAEKNLTITLGSAKEFNFENIDGVNSSVESDWWANEKVLGEEVNIPGKDWSFFPMVQTGVS